MADRRIEYMPLTQIQPATRNPKRHDTAGIRRSIGKFGLAEAPLLDERTGRLVAGHGRINDLAERRSLGADPPDGVQAGEDGEWLVPVVRGWASRSDGEAEAYLAASNQLSVTGGWADDELATMLAALAEADLLDVTGFTDDDLADLLGPPGVGVSGYGAHPGDTDRGYGAGIGTGHGTTWPKRADTPSLADRFIIPPFDVLDTRQGYWRERKRYWLALGIASEVGRDSGLAFGTAAIQDPDFYAKKNAFEAKLGRPLTYTEFVAEHYERAGDPWMAGTSIFDPVLAELVYRWFSPVGGVVVDPFAGGSVRGIVAAACGRAYHGIDLRPEQVKANEAQAEEICGPYIVADTTRSVPARVGDPDALTPVERHDGILVKRDDLFRVGGSCGGKVRSALALIGAPGVRGVVTAGSRHSPQVNIVASIAARYGLPCRVHVPSGALTPELLAAQATGAEVVQHTPGYNNVIIARAREDAADRGWLDVPFGMETPAAIAETRRQVANLPFADFQRLVIPIGSGMSLAGVLHGLRDAGKPAAHVQVLGVIVGAEPTDRLDRYAPTGWRERVTVVKSDLGYEAHAPDTTLGNPGLILDPVYEAKCLPYLGPGDLLWVVGRRETVGDSDSPAFAVPGGLTMPRWSVGDALNVLPTLPAESADLIFTCPPYYDLEKYSDDPADLSTMPYGQFDEVYGWIIAAAAAVLRPDRFAVIVVGDVRDPKGRLRDLRGLTIRAAEAAGMTLASGAVLLTPIGSAARRASRAFLGTRTLARVHQNVLVFCKGDRKRAALACGDVEVHLPISDDE